MTKPISSLLHDASNRACDVIHKAYHLGRLEKKVKAHLYSDLAQSIRLGRYRNGCLVLFVKNGTWLTYIKFRYHSILKQLRQFRELTDLQELDLRVDSTLFAK